MEDTQLPQALWVVGATAEGAFSSRPKPEYPLTYRFAYAAPLTDAQEAALQAGLAHPLLGNVRHFDPQQPLAGVTALAATTSDMSLANELSVYEVQVARPHESRAALKVIKQVTRPACRYTALLYVSSAYRPARNISMVWVGVRDELLGDERQQLAAALDARPEFDTVATRGIGSFELRVATRLTRDPKRLTGPLRSAGIMPDFSVTGPANSFDEAFDSHAGF